MSLRCAQLKQWVDCSKMVGRHATSLASLREEMTARKLPQLHDEGSKMRSDLMDATFYDVLPNRDFFRMGKSHDRIPEGYHLIYFHPATPLSSLFPDGTDPIHSPGLPFTRRMWAGGDISFDDDLEVRDRVFLRCNESITDVEIKGNEGEEKVFVNIQRKIGYMARDGKHEIEKSSQYTDPVVENRKLVFMRDHTHPPESPGIPRHVIKHPHQADVRHTFITSPALLFRFSALTFNAHAIHLDKKYCQDVEGHRNLLVHGPLTVLLMLQFLKDNLSHQSYRGRTKDKVITYVSYRNIAPLYAEEKMTLCVRWKENHLWETWIEGPDGGLAVKGSVRTARKFPLSKEGEDARSVTKVLDPEE
ncbi:MAG: hypothetical protein Q9166_001423 [cf. Caloplaca sp. 2 TL-2023]